MYPSLFLLSNAESTKQPLENILHVGSQGIASYVNGHASFLGNGIESRILLISNDPTILLSGAMLEAISKSNIKHKS